MEKVYSLEKLCDIIGISFETGKNWERLDKITPDTNKKYSKKYVEALLIELNSDDNKILKNRRNKKYVSGRKINSTYIEGNSVNQLEVVNFINDVENSGILITSEIVEFICLKIAKTLAFQSPLHNRDCLFIDDYIENPNVDSFAFEELIRKRDFRYIEKEDTLGLIYQALNNLKKRKAQGAYYTPTSVVQKLVNQVFEEGNFVFKDNMTVCDPCCGTGNFLLQLPDKIAFNQIYGNDVDKTAVKLARINLAMKFSISEKKELEKHITCKNYFTNKINKHDVFIGNPPWGCEFKNREQNYFRTYYECSKKRNTEAFDLAVEKAIKNVRDCGKIAFVLPEAILNVNTHKEIRNLILRECQILSISFIGNAFEGVQAPSILLQLKKDNSNFSTKGTRIESNEQTFVVETERRITAKNFGLYANDEEYEIIEKICNSKDVVYLKDNALFGLGIVSGGNNDLISEKWTSGSEVILKGTDIYPYVYRESNNYIHFIPENFQQVAPTEIYRAPKKLLYKFINDKLVFAYDDKQHVTLNSCNVVIPQIVDMDIKYVMAVLNSDMAQFIFKKKFNSVKVLRSHIEQIPIPRASKEFEKEIVDLVDKVIYEGNTEAIQIINKKINDIYKKIK